MFHIRSTCIDREVKYMPVREVVWDWGCKIKRILRATSLWQIWFSVLYIASYFFKMLHAEGSL